jgi:hypothetical protein
LSINPGGPDAQKVIEADEVIHVGVGDEDVVDLEDHAGRKRLDGAQVKEQGFPAVSQIQVQGGIPEGVVDESCIEHGQPVRGFHRKAGIPFPTIFPSAPGDEKILLRPRPRRQGYSLKIP